MLCVPQVLRTVHSQFFSSHSSTDQDVRKLLRQVCARVCVCVLAALCASIQPSMFAASTLTLPHVTHNHAGTTVPALCAWWGAPDFLGCVPAGRSIGTPACCAPGRFLRSSVTTTHNVHDAAAAAAGALTWLPLCCTLAASDWLARWRTAHTALGGVVPRQRLGR